MEFSLTIDGDTRVIRKLEGMEKAIKNSKAILSDVGDVLVTEFEGNFPEEGARLGKKWKKLAASTRVQKARMGYGAMPILVRTGELMRGFKKELTRYRVRVHNPVSYFRYHQAGEGNNPQRKMIDFPERLKQEVLAVFTKFLAEITK